MKWLREQFHSENFWLILSVILAIMTAIAIGANAVALAKNNPMGFLSLASPLGISGIFGLLAPGFPPGILLVGTLTMRNIARHNQRQDWINTHQSYDIPIDPEQKTHNP